MKYPMFPKLLQFAPLEKTLSLTLPPKQSQTICHEKVGGQEKNLHVSKSKISLMYFKTENWLNLGSVYQLKLGDMKESS